MFAGIFRMVVLFCIPRLLKIGLKILLWFSLGVQRLDNEGFGMRTFSL